MWKLALFSQIWFKKPSLSKSGLNHEITFFFPYLVCDSLLQEPTHFREKMLLKICNVDSKFIGMPFIITNWQFKTFV
jgi:hypothetical protein